MSWPIIGYNRDGKPGKKQLVAGLADRWGWGADFH